MANFRIYQKTTGEPVYLATERDVPCISAWAAATIVASRRGLGRVKVVSAQKHAGTYIETTNGKYIMIWLRK